MFGILETAKCRLKQLLKVNLGYTGILKPVPQDHIQKGGEVVKGRRRLYI